MCDSIPLSLLGLFYSPEKVVVNVPCELEKNMQSALV